MPQARTIDDAQAKTFIAFLNTLRNALRNKCAFALSYYAGMRCLEISAINLADCLTDKGAVRDTIYLKPHMTKGSKGREVFLNKTVKLHIHNLVKSMSNDVSQPLIQVMGVRKAFTSNSLAILFSNLYKDAGFVGCSSHTGRRSFCSNLASNGTSIRVIQKLSGHRSLASVMPYLDANEHMVRNAVESLS
jgi:integrase/recombinase XerD